MARVEIFTEACKSCSYCVITCPKNTLEIGEQVNSKGYLYARQIRPEDCVGCKMCAEICPDAAIEVWR